MIKIKTKIGELIIIEVNKNDYDFQKYFDNDNWLDYFNPNKKDADGYDYCEIVDIGCKFDIIGVLSELNDELEVFIDSKPHRQSNYDLYMNYMNHGYTLGDIKESFISLLKSQYPDFNEINDNDWLILKPL